MSETKSWLKLRCEVGTAVGEEITVDVSPFVIGRDQTANLFLDDASVSRLHSALVLRDDQWILQDLGGKNPPRVHGRATVSIPLVLGDLITVGAQVFRVSEMAGLETGDNSGVAQSIELPANYWAVKTHRPQQLAGRRLWTILEKWTAMVRNLDTAEDLLEIALDGFLDVIPADRGGVYRLDSESGSLVTLATRNLEGDDPIGNAAFQVLYSETIIARSIKAHRAKLFAPETDGSEPAGADRSVARSRSMIRKRIRSALCLPLLADQRVLGIVYLDQVDDTKPPLLSDDLELGTLLASWLAEAMEKAERFRDLDEEVLRLSGKEKDSQTMLVGESEGIKKVQRRIRKVARTDVTALIMGESGTGKELVARAIHERSSRKLAPFVAINCAAIPDTLLESELFGYAPKSGIHGADPAGKPGRFELAQDGTIVLDEIGELPLGVQAKLLRVLEERVIDRLGGREPVPVNVRVIAMTNRDLAKEVETGQFREDLFYRLHVFPILVPPLRERTEDVMPIARHLLEHLVEDKKVTISPRAIETLKNYQWPGNVRELKNILLEAVVAGDGRSINPRDLSLGDETSQVSFQSLRDVERHHVEHVLCAVNGNKKKAAELLGIHRSTLYEKIAEYSLRSGRND